MRETFRIEVCHFCHSWEAKFETQNGGKYYERCAKFLNIKMRPIDGKKIGGVLYTSELRAADHHKVMSELEK